MSTIKKILMLVSVMCLLSACVTHGNKFDLAKVDQLQPGTSTRSDAVQLLGTPSAESAMPKNMTLLQWQYSQGSLVGGSGAHVAILFDQGGKMVQVTHKFSSGQ